MEQLRLDRVFRYAPDGIKVLTFAPGDYLIGQGYLTEEVAREAIACGVGFKIQSRYAKKVIRERGVK